VAIYKPSLLDKFKNFVNGLKSNWDEYEDHVAEFEAHAAESSAKHITKSGSNGDGRYIQFDDGTQICYMDKDYTGVAINAEYGALFRSNENLQVSYPASFSSTPTLSLQSKIYTVQFVYINGVSPTFFTFRPVRVSSTDSIDFSISAIAIGRWK
jgi:hypothetical protein